MESEADSLISLVVDSIPCKNRTNLASYPLSGLVVCIADHLARRTCPYSSTCQAANGGGLQAAAPTYEQKRLRQHPASALI